MITSTTTLGETSVLTNTFDLADTSYDVAEVARTYLGVEVAP